MGGDDGGAALGVSGVPGGAEGEGAEGAGGESLPDTETQLTTVTAVLGR